MKKNISIIIPSLVHAGAEKQSVYLAKVLSQYYSVNLIVLNGKKIEEKYFQLIEKNDITICRLKGGMIRNLIDTYKIFRKHNTQFAFSYLASSNLINSFAGIFARVPYRVGGIRNSELPKRKITLERFFHNHLLTHSISNNHAGVASLTKLKFNNKKFHVIHNAFDLQQPLIQRKRKKVVSILSVARFVPQKDFFTALEAIKILSLRFEKNNPCFLYYLVGYGSMESRIREKIEELDLGKYVDLIIKPKNLGDYFMDSDIFFVSSLFEGMSNSVMEALSYSLPVVSTNAGDMAFLVKDNYNGFICEKRNPVDMAGKLEKLILDYALRSEMGENSFQIISTDFSLMKFENDYLSFLKSLNVYNTPQI